MIISKEQRDCVLPNGEIGKELIISYVNKQGKIQFLQYKIPVDQMFQWEYCTKRTMLQADSIFRSWDNKPIKRKKCKKLNEFRINELLSSFGDKISPLFDSTVPETWFCDIETQISEEGFTEPESARMPINTIALTKFPETIVWGRKPLSEAEQISIQKKLDTYAPDKIKGYKFTYRYFSNEADMIIDFLKFIKDIPALTGWNFVGYDWLYIINRCKLLSIDYKFISPTGAFMQWKLNNKSGNINCPVPMHKVIYDYMLIMKRWEYSLKPYESWKLDWVAEKALGVKKVEHPDFLTFYNDHYEDYVFYNAVDTILVELIDKMIHMADVMFSLAAELKIEIKDTLSTITPVHTAITNFIYKQNKVFPVIDKGDSERGDYEGAFVWPSQPGVYKYVCGVDAQSMYPGIIRQFQISPENFLGMAEKGYIRKPDEIVTKSGAIFKKDKNAVLPAICKFYFLERVAAKGCKKVAAKQYKDFLHIYEKREKGKAPKTYKNSEKNYSQIDPLTCSMEELWNETERLCQLMNYYENKQLAFKIFINSIYGACGNQYMRLFLLEAAEAITLQGQDLNHYTENCINHYLTYEFQKDIDLHKKLGIDTEKAQQFNLNCGRLTKTVVDLKSCHWLDPKIGATSIVYGDTDSVYTELGRLINFFNIPDDQACQWILTLWNDGINKYLQQKFQEYSDKYNCDENLQVWELEKILRTALVYAKKHNALEVGWDDSGIFYGPMEKVSYTGLEVVQGSTPVYAKKCQKEMIEYVLEHYSHSSQRPEYSDLIMMLKKYKAQMPLQDPDDICKSMGISDYNKWILEDKNTVTTRLHTPFHVKAAAVANHFLYKNKKYMTKYNFIKSGDKVKFYYTTDKNFDAFGFQPGEFPVEFAPKIDYEQQFDKLILTPLNSLIGKVLGYNELNVTLCYSESLF